MSNNHKHKWEMTPQKNGGWKALDLTRHLIHHLRPCGAAEWFASCRSISDQSRWRYSQVNDRPRDGWVTTEYGKALAQRPWRIPLFGFMALLEPQQRRHHQKRGRRKWERRRSNKESGSVGRVVDEIVTSFDEAGNWTPGLRKCKNPAEIVMDKLITREQPETNTNHHETARTELQLLHEDLLPRCNPNSWTDADERWLEPITTVGTCQPCPPPTWSQGTIKRTDAWPSTFLIHTGKTWPRPRNQINLDRITRKVRYSYSPGGHGKGGWI